MTDATLGDIFDWTHAEPPSFEREALPRIADLTDEFAMSASLPSTYKEWCVRDRKQAHLLLRIRGPASPKTAPDAAKAATSKRWYFCAKALDEGEKPEKKLIGAVGEISCDEARLRASEMSRLRHLGVTLPRETGLTPIVLADAYDRYSERFAPSKHWQRSDSLMRRFVIPSMGAKRLSTLGRPDFVACLTSAAQQGRTPVTVLHKRLRAFLYWATDRGFTHANPLARSAPPVASRRMQVLLHAKTLGQIYAASREMSWPWSGMIGLLFLAQLSVRAARHVRVYDVNWTDETICPPGCDRSSTSHWEALSQMALHAIAPSRDAKEWLFQSPISDGPYDLRGTIRRELQERASTSTRWTWSDLVRSIRAAFDAFKDQRAPAGGNIEAQRQLQNAWVEELLRLNDECLRSSNPAIDDELEL